MDNSACLFSILNKPISEKVDLLIGKPIESGITTAGILEGVVSLIFDYVVLEPAFCPMFAQLCSDLKRKVKPFPFPSDEPGGKQITVMRMVLNTCQEAFEDLDRLREEITPHMNAPDQQESTCRDEERSTVMQRGFGSVRLMGGLFKLKMVHEKIVHLMMQELLGPDSKTCLEEAKVEAICQFLHIISKQLDESQESRCTNDLYFNQLKEM